MQVVVVSCDALPLSLMGCYGNQFVDTPNLDRLAHQGFVFDHAYVADPVESAAVAVPADRPAWPTVRAAVQSGRGKLLAVSDRPEGVPRSLRRGFDRFEQTSTRPRARVDRDFASRLAENPAYRLPADDHPLRDHYLARWAEGLRIEKATEATSLERSVDAGIALVERFRDRDFLLWFDIAWLGGAWLPPAEFESQFVENEEVGIVRDPVPGAVRDEQGPEAEDAAAWSGLGMADLPGVRAGYGAKLAFFDAELGRLLDSLEKTAVWEEGALFVTSSAGLPMGEHSVVGFPPAWPYEPLVHVPLLGRVADAREAARSLALVRGADLLPTIEELFNGTPAEPMEGGPAPEFLPGSLLPLMRGDRPLLRDYVVTGSSDVEYALRTQEWKLVLPMVPPATGPLRQRELYLKPEDRWDVNDVVERHSDVADLLELQLRRYLDAARLDAWELYQPLRESLPHVAE